MQQQINVTISPFVSQSSPQTLQFLPGCCPSHVLQSRVKCCCCPLAPCWKVHSGTHLSAITDSNHRQTENSPADRWQLYYMNWKLTSALCLPVADGGVDQVAARSPVEMAFATLLAEPRPWQEAQTGWVRLSPLEGSASSTERHSL